jgi:glycosyltransferase involved in cell wall biosynthesis
MLQNMKRQNNKPRIAVIGLKGLPPFGGASTVGENIILTLKDKYDFTVLSVSTHTNMPTGYYKGIKQIVFKSRLKRTGLNTAIYYIRSIFYVLFHRFDIIHLHHDTPGCLVLFLKLKYKVVLTVHGYIEEDDPKFSNIANKLCVISKHQGIRLSNVVVSVSKTDQECLISKFKREIKYIPNGIWKPELCDRGLINEKGYILFSAGRIYSRKGLHLLLDAAHVINLDNEIYIVGDIDRIPSYKEEMLSKSKGLNVKYFGLIEEKKRLMDIVSKSSLFVFPSLWEGMSMMLLEVVSQGVPIIASDIPSNTSVFDDNEMLFFRSGNSNDLARKISFALVHYQEMKLKANNAYKKLSEKYTWDSIGKQYEAIYNSLLK